MCFKIKRLGNHTPLRAIAHRLASPPGSAAPRVRHALWDQNCIYRCSRRLVGEPVTGGVWLQQLGSFFLRTKKSLSARMQRARAIACRLEPLGAAGLKKHLPVLTTARWRARNIGSVVQVARLLFFEYKKKVSVHTCSARGQ